jgi:chitinase
MSARVIYEVVDAWSGGFNASVSVVAGDDGLGGWTLTFEAEFEITQIWGAEIVSRTGDTYVVRNAPWNGSVAPGGTVEFGFLGGPTTDPVPDAFLLNGVLVGDLPAISVADATVVEGNAGTRTLAFVVTLSAASATPVTVTYATANGTALAGADYAALGGSLTFAAGETRKVVRVTVNGDTAVEADETLRLVLSGAAGATLLDGEAIGTVRDDDTPPRLTVGDIQVTEGDAGTAAAVFTVRLSKAWNQAVTVAYATQAGTALAGSDFLGTSGSLSFAAGETVKTVSVAIVGDRVQEASESFTLRLSGANGASIADGIGVATIRDNDTPPSVAVADVALEEGDAGTASAVFTLRLDKAWGEAVSVGFTTANGTALAGQDYVARSGTVTFAAGQTVKTVAIAVKGDTVEEADEAFSLLLRNPSGLTIRDGTGLATIADDDGPAGVGFLSTSGNQIIDANGNAVRITGVNWFGMESSTFTPHGMWARNWSEMMDQMADLGFNTIRLPFSLEALQPGKVPNGIDVAKNPDLIGLTAIEILDKIVAHAGEIGMRIILDNHRSASGAGPNGNGLWIDGGYTEQQWIDTWTMLAGRYAGDPTVIGADLANEPHAATWGGGGANDWTAAAERAGNAIHAVNDDWLIFVEGVGSYAGANYWWGGNLKGVEFDPVVLNTPGKLVYSPHDYGNSIYEQAWFSDPAFPNNLPQKFDEFWGYIYREGIAPVMVGEFGSRLQDPKDEAWLDKLLPYMDGDFDANGTRDIPAGDEGMSWTWWSWNPNSGDTGGILADDWTTPIQAKMDLLTPQLSDLWGPA